ncbi:hypothetical protein ACIBCH_18800 [Amycolatopsis thailandensis]|uniref:hypothetical protein n=1 Tax=Amycolatopsis thailandensis TaxID=589330 RepID=UPI0037880B90
MITFMITLVTLGNPLWLVGLTTLSVLALVLGLPFTRLSLRFPSGWFAGDGAV